MSFSRIAASSCLVTVLLASSSAFAQQPPPGAQPAPPAAAPAPADPNAPPPAVAPGQPAQPPVAPPAEEAEEKARFRWGISGFGGKFFAGDVDGGTGGLALRFGAQINNMFGVYGSPVLMVGAGVEPGTPSATGAVESKSAVFALAGVGVLGDITLSDMFYLAIGPELLSGGGAGVGASSGSGATAKAEAGTFLGVEARAGLALGSVKPNRRKAFTIGLDLHAVFMSEAFVAPVLALGYDSF